MKTKLLAGLAILVGVVLASVRAEKVAMTAAEMKTMATHIVTGTVQGTYQNTTVSGDYKRTHYVAEVRIKEIEKGDGLKREGLVYVRYWQQEWVGKGDPPPNTNGHRGVPAQGETLRIYLAQNAYDGFGTSKDGGYNVLGADGFEKLKSATGK